jgi:putative endonuclease
VSRARGAEFEALAARHLEAQGLRILARNVCFRGGELDLVAEHGGTVVFVEVRYRASAAFGDASESVALRKQQRLVRAAEQFLARHDALARRPCRFDLVAIDGAAPPRLEWLRDAFRPES